jgi:hypothetical protein
MRDSATFVAYHEQERQMANQTAAARAIDVFVSAVEARGGKAEVTTKGSVKLVHVTTADRTYTVRVKASTTSTWQARKSEAAEGRTPVDVWALVQLPADGITLVSSSDYAAHVTGLIDAWPKSNPGKDLTATTNLGVTAESFASGADAWSLLGFDGAASPAPEPSPAKPVTAEKAPAKKAVAKKTAAKKAPAKPTAKPAEAKITKIADQRAAAERAKAPATIPTVAAETAPKTETKKAPAEKKTPAKASAKKAPAKPAAKPTDTKTTAKATDTKTTGTKAAAKPAPKIPKVAANTVEVTAADRAAKSDKTESVQPKAAPAKAPEQSGNRQPSGIALLLKRLPVVGRLL